MQDLKVTLIQTALHWHDAAKNRQMFSELIDQVAGPTDLIILPEMFSSGFTMAAADNAETMDGPTVTWLREQATQQQTTLTGSLIIEAEGHYYNRLIWMSPDGQVTTYDKRHLFRMAREHDHYAPGMARQIVKLKGWRICPQICYDLRFPVWSRNRNEYELLFYVANWPQVRRYAWQTLLKARAIENLCYVVGVNRVGTDGNGLAYSGDSVALDFLGQEIFAHAEEPFIQTVRLNYQQLLDYRSNFPAHLDADEFEIKAAPPPVP